MLGRKSIHAKEAHAGNFIGAGWFPEMDLTNTLSASEYWREFNKVMIPVYLAQNPEKTKIAAGLACGFLYTVTKGIQIGDIVLSPNGKGEYLVGEVTTDYNYQKDGTLPHRRGVRWFSKTIERSLMTQTLQNSTGSIGTVSDVTRFAEEIEKLISGDGSVIATTDGLVDDPTVFGLEKHLEEFLVHNWKQTEFGKDYDVFEEDGEPVGQQYPSDTGPIDILAIRKDKKELLVIELKRGRISDVVVGQIQRYMGYVKEELAEDGQTVRGVIIALEDDLRLRRALSVAANIQFYTYKISFALEKR